MRVRAGEIANAIAWAFVLVLAAVAILIAYLLGFFGLVILGLFTWLICTHLELEDDTPVSSPAIYRARLQQARTPEQRAAATADRQTRLSPLRFYRLCGIALTVIGAGGWAWQYWWVR
jgi:hypothetical protein